MKKFLKFVCAFSLVEVMISLVIVSSILAAFTPVLTKKTKRTVNVVSSVTKLTSDCSGTFSSDCSLCQGTKKCYICSKQCLNSTYKDVDTCTCKPCSEIDVNCTSCQDFGKCTSCKSGYYLENNQCNLCPAGYYCTNNIKIACPAGTFGQGDGARSSCTPCPGGTYSSVTAATSSAACSPCPSGTYSVSGAISCTPCESGYYSNGGIKTSCSSKTPNCANCNKENGSCTNCAIGYKLIGKVVNNSYVTSCINPCSVGYFYISEADVCMSTDRRSCSGGATCTSKGSYCSAESCCWGSYHCTKSAAQTICAKHGDRLATMEMLTTAMKSYQSHINFSKSSYITACSYGPNRNVTGGPGYICYPNIVWGSDGIAAINNDGSITSNPTRPDGMALSVFCIRNAD